MRKPMPPDMPPPTPAEIALQQQISEGLREMTRLATQRNLDNAVLLAQQAARGHGPLVDHFHEIGRRFAGELNKPGKPALRVVR